MTRVLVISDVRLYREGLVRFLTRDGRLNPVGSAGSWCEAESLIAKVRADVALVDLVMREAPPIVRQLFAEPTRVVGMGLSEKEDDLLGWAEMGISGYVRRDATLEDLVRAVESAVRDELPCSASVAAALLRRVGKLASRLETPTGANHLTSREQEILMLLDHGLTNKQISSRLVIEVSTVKNHVHNILEKLGAQTRGEAASKARRLGLSPLGGEAMTSARSMASSS